MTTTALAAALDLLAAPQAAPTDLDSIRRRSCVAVRLAADLATTTTDRPPPWRPRRRRRWDLGRADRLTTLDRLTTDLAADLAAPRHWVAYNIETAAGGWPSELPR